MASKSEFQISLQIVYHMPPESLGCINPVNILFEPVRLLKQDIHQPQGCDGNGDEDIHESENN